MSASTAQRRQDTHADTYLDTHTPNCHTHTLSLSLTHTLSHMHAQRHTNTVTNTLFYTHTNFVSDSKIVLRHVEWSLIKQTSGLTNYKVP